jgi:hypothetical protein
MWYRSSVFKRVQKIVKNYISFVMSVRPSEWNNLGLIGRIFKKFDI